MLTHFASAARAPAERVDAMVAELAADPAISALLDALGGVVLVLNEHRQVVAINAHSLEAMGVGEPTSLLGLRPGELLGCLNAACAPSGCGTSRACRDCGAVLSILAAQQGTEDPEPRQCLLRCEGEDLAFEARASRIEVAGRSYTLLTLQDQQDQLERQHLERVFLHDLSNTLVGLQMLAHTPGQDDPSAELSASVERLVVMILAERRRLHLEAGTYVPTPTPLRLGPLVQHIAGLQGAGPQALGLELGVRLASDPVVDVDEGLLGRVVENMILNALEASQPGDQVTVTVSDDGTRARVEVCNPGVIPEEVQRRIFTRWYSTKGTGRGLGTWSMLHLSRRYLGGDVGFVSEDGQTCFWLELPLDAEHH